MSRQASTSSDFLELLVCFPKGRGSVGRPIGASVHSEPSASVAFAFGPHRHRHRIGIARFQPYLPRFSPVVAAPDRRRTEGVIEVVRILPLRESTRRVSRHSHPVCAIERAALPVLATTISPPEIVQTARNACPSSSISCSRSPSPSFRAAPRPGTEVRWKVACPAGHTPRCRSSSAPQGTPRDGPGRLKINSNRHM